jgi:hypothetical protein
MPILEKDEVSHIHRSRRSALKVETAGSGTHLWNYQRSDGIPAIFTTRVCKSEFGMEFGLPGLQPQAHPHRWSQSPRDMMEARNSSFDKDAAPMTESRPCKNQKARFLKNRKSGF